MSFPIETDGQGLWTSFIAEDSAIVEKLDTFTFNLRQDSTSPEIVAWKMLYAVNFKLMALLLSPKINLPPMYTCTHHITVW